MVERKTTRTSKSTSEARAFVVVLEEIRAQNKAFGEGLQGLRERMDVRFDAADRRFEGIELRLGRVELDVGLVKTAVLQHSRELEGVRMAIEKKVDRDEVEAIVERIATRGR
jgi:hypothetical protein